MAKIRRTLVLIDGSNFYFKLKKLGIANLARFDYRAFVAYLTTNTALQKATYYVGAVRQDGSTKSEVLLKNQQRLLAKLEQHDVRYSLGYLLKSGGMYHEKGVDVQMAVDMLIAAYERQVEVLVLVSSDTDLIPAITQVQKLGVSVLYVGFARQLSRALQRACAGSVALRPTTVQDFIEK